MIQLSVLKIKKCVPFNNLGKKNKRNEKQIYEIHK